MPDSRTRFDLTRRTALLGAAAIVCAGPALAAEDPIFANWRGHAIRGYDPVAYFTEGRAVEGSSDHKFDYMGATWRFASAENRAKFEENPEAYAPQYGGYCAYAVSQGYTASVDPEAWDITDGKLYLNYSKSVQTTWREDRPGYIAKANENWPKVLE